MTGPRDLRFPSLTLNLLDARDRFTVLRSRRRRESPTGDQVSSVYLFDPTTFNEVLVGFVADEALIPTLAARLRPEWKSYELRWEPHAVVGRRRAGEILFALVQGDPRPARLDAPDAANRHDPTIWRVCSDYATALDYAIPLSQREYAQRSASTIVPFATGWVWEGACAGGQPWPPVPRGAPSAGSFILLTGEYDPQRYPARFLGPVKAVADADTYWALYPRSLAAAEDLPPRHTIIVPVPPGWTPEDECPRLDAVPTATWAY